MILAGNCDVDCARAGDCIPSISSTMKAMTPHPYFFITPPSFVGFICQVATFILLRARRYARKHDAGLLFFLAFVILYPTMELKTETRDVFGKRNKALRAEGRIPAELYGHGVPNTHLVIDTKEFTNVFCEAGENTVVTLLVGGEKRPTLIHDVVHDYLTGEVEHVDFYQVRMDEVIRAHVPIEFVGESPAVKAAGGILNKTISEIEVEALPADLPHRFTVDLGALAELEHSIYVRDLTIPTGVKIHLAPETVIVTVSAPRKEEEIIAPVAAVDVTEVKVETEEKKAERDKEKGEKEEA